MTDDSMNVEQIAHLVRGEERVIQGEDGRQWALRPPGYVLEAIGPKHDAAPPYTIAERTFHDGDSLATYANTFKEEYAQLFADIDAGLITIVLDHDSPKGASVRKHVAKLPIRQDEAFKEWNAMTGKFHDQEEFLYFLEQNATDVVSPEPASLLELVKDFSGFKSVTFGQAIRLDNGDRQIAFKSETKTGDIVVPQKLQFNLPIYHGEERVDLVALFRYSVGEAKNSIRFRIDWHRLEPVKQAAFRLAATRIAEACGLVPLFGKPS